MGIFSRKASISKSISSHVPSLRKHKDDDDQKRVVMKDAQRETYQYTKKNQELGTTELIKNHQNGNRFLYAAVTSKSSEENHSLLRRLIQFQPRMNRKYIPLSNLPRIDLFDEVETFKRQDILPKKSGATTFINISEIMIIYGSLISTDDIFSKVKVSIIGDRKLQDKVAKSFVANTNLCSRAVLSLPYCFPRNETDAISLTLSRESAFLEQGRQWGAAQVMIQLRETDFPEQYSVTPVQALNNLPESMFEVYETNPNSIDISIMNNDKKALRELYMSGDIADETSPIMDKTENIKYSKSSLRDVKGKKNDSYRTDDWKYINETRVAIKEAENSISVEESGDDESDSSFITKLKESKLKEERSKNEISQESSSSSPVLKSAMKRHVKIEDPLPIIHNI